MSKKVGVLYYIGPADGARIAPGMDLGVSDYQCKADNRLALSCCPCIMRVPFYIMRNAVPLEAKRGGCVMVDSPWCLLK